MFTAVKQLQVKVKLVSKAHDTKPFQLLAAYEDESYLIQTLRPGNIAKAFLNF